MQSNRIVWSYLKYVLKCRKSILKPPRVFHCNRLL